MLDVIVPIPVSNAELVDGCLESLEAFTDVPMKIIGVIDGGIRQDIEQIERAFANLSCEWQLLHCNPPEQLNGCIRSALEQGGFGLIAIVGPEVRLEDEKWFGKVKAVLDRDPAVGVIDMWPNTESATVPPVRRDNRHICPEGCRFAIVRRGFVDMRLPFGDLDPIAHWSRQAILGGWSSWAAMGVKYLETEHKEHELWRAPLARADHSE